MNLVCVITTIHAPTAAMNSWAEVAPVVIAPDVKTPLAAYAATPYIICQSTRHYGMDLLPENHYSRKMLGYLEAFHLGATAILDTDDDTSLSTHKSPIEVVTLALASRSVRGVSSASGFVNMYALRSNDRYMWPRGLPLQAISDPLHVEDVGALTDGEPWPSVTQFLIDGDSDVDAIHRLVFGVQDTRFDQTGTLDVVATSAFCPFNSQLTMWDPSVLPLMYLPSTVTFRFTDILRSVVGKRILDRHGRSVCFADSIGLQTRNPHDYMQDFVSEIPCYLQTAQAWEAIGAALSDSGGIDEQMLQAYASLCDQGICSPTELEVLSQWIGACRELGWSGDR